MSILLNQTIWIYRNETVATGAVTLPWRNFDELNSGQFFLKYGGAGTVTFALRLSPIEANGLETDASGNALLPANAYEEIAVLASGAHGSEGFFIPTAGGPFDRPWRSWSGVFTPAGANLTNCYFALCANGIIG